MFFQASKADWMLLSFDEWQSREKNSHNREKNLLKVLPLAENIDTRYDSVRLENSHVQLAWDT